MTPAVPPPPPAANQSGGSLSGSRPPSVGPQSKSKYILDPSVKSGPTYGNSGYGQNQAMYGNPMQSQPFSTPGSFPAQSPYMVYAFTKNRMILSSSVARIICIFISLSSRSKWEISEASPIQLRPHFTIPRSRSSSEDHRNRVC